ncbi:MAG TPA: 4Fe-4S binding protein [Acidimicrobiales bacterium]|nr:4Fe-4S binding protein [Acidimicrobiales bacterium]
MSAAVTIDLRCTGCGACIVTCPERALARAPKRPLVITERCTTCMACIEVCPVDAVSLAAGTRVLRTTPAAAGGGPSPTGPHPAAPTGRAVPA